MTRDLSQPPATLAPMTRRPDPERIHLARRDALRGNLTQRGMPADRAEVLVVAWEAEAARQGLERHSAAFWQGADAWIDSRRRRACRSAV